MTTAIAPAPLTPGRVPAAEPFVPTGALPGRGMTVLEASAGTGKTYSIATLVLRLVAEEGVPVERILAVTFTVDATAELRDRVRARLVAARDAFAAAAASPVLGGRPACGGDEVVHHLLERAAREGALAAWGARLRAAVERFDDAPVFTIHGFCQRMLREHAFECGAPLDAELEGDVRPLLDEVVRDFWVARMGMLDPATVRDLAGAGLTLEALADVARKATDDRDLVLVPKDDGADADGAVPDAACRRARDTVDAFRDAFGRHRDACRDTLLAAAKKKVVDGRRVQARYIDGWYAKVDEWLGSGALDERPDELDRLTTSALRTLSTPPGVLGDVALAPHVDAVLAEFPALRAAVGASVTALKRDCAEYARREVARRRRARRVLGYDDLLHLLRDALRGDSGAALAGTLGARYDAVLVDEFQDTDAVQWELFATAFGGGAHRLVLIGDPKQAVYGFRGADVETYLHACRGADRRMVLGTNYRSDGPLVDALNAAYGAFAEGAAPSGGAPSPFAHAGIAYAPVAAHVAHARIVGPDESVAAPLRVRLLPREGRLATDDPTKPVAKGRVHAVLPGLVAADVVRFLESGAQIVDVDGARDVSPRDVAVLVRTNREGRAVQAALRAARVPCVLRSATSVFASAEAEELARVLAAVADPEDRYAVRAAVATDLLGLAGAAELAAAADGDGGGDGDVLGALGVGDVLLALRDDEACWERWDVRFRRWRAAWRGERAGRSRRTGGVAGAVRAILEDMALPERLLALIDGERRMTNLLHLTELLHAAAVREALGPEALLGWFRTRITEGAEGRGDDGSAQLRLESDDDAAQVVTVHKSKGLEYPAVWCPYLWDGGLASEADERHPRYTDHATGTPARVLDLAPVGVPDPNDAKKRLDAESVARMKDAAYQEAHRLTYVALTRARHRCTVWWGGINDAATSALGWLLHGPAAGLSPDDGVRAVRETMAGAFPAFDDAQIRDGLHALAARASGRIEVATEAMANATANPRWTRPHVPAPALVARAWTRTTPLDDAWRLGSFTGLTHAAVHGGVAGHSAASRDAAPAAPSEAATADPDLVPESLGDVAAPEPPQPEAEPADGPDAAATSPPVPLAEMPRNAAIGTCVHGILEHHDYTDDAALDERTRAALAAHRFDADRWTAPLADAIRRALATPLAVPDVADADPLRLATVPPTRRLAELRFELPVCGGLAARDERPVTADALAAVFSAHPGGPLDGAAINDYAARVRALGFRALRGFLTGAIDLVVPHGERWWLVDWKSNYLGPTAADYASERLGAAMRHAHYVLQYHLYLVALHRWLGLRLPAYDYDRHVGGAAYVFLRGVDGGGAGVFVDRPPRARIEALDRLLRTGASA